MDERLGATLAPPQLEMTQVSSPSDPARRASRSGPHPSPQPFLRKEIFQVAACPMKMVIPWRRACKSQAVEKAHCAFQPFSDSTCPLIQRPFVTISAQMQLIY